MRRTRSWRVLGGRLPPPVGQQLANEVEAYEIRPQE